MSTKRIAIVGGGMTGLTAAYYLKKEITRLHLPYKVKVIEASNRLGGKIKTFHHQGFILESGADSFLERKKPATKLVKELGLTNELVRNATGQAHVLVNNTLFPLPAGSYMGIPIQEDALTNSQIISENGKRRVHKEQRIPKGTATSDQSLGKFLRYRFGDELIENVVEPLLSGIYSSDIDKMSLMASFPAFYELEQKYGSVTQGLRETLPLEQSSTGKRKGQFLTLQNGLETIINKLYEVLRNEMFMFCTKVEKATKEGLYELKLSDGQTEQADAVIMTTPHSSLPSIFDAYPLFSTLKQIPMSSVANVVLAFDKDAFPEGLDGTGFVVSRNSNFRMTACTWTHRKWPHTTPEGKALLRTYVGKPSEQEVVNVSDEEMISIVLAELEIAMGITVEPNFAFVTRWKNVMPQYTIGHIERLKKIQCSLEEKLPGLYLAGSSFHGIGIPDCIGQGEEVALKVLAYLDRI